MKKISSYKLTPFFFTIFLSLSIASCKKGDAGTPGIDGASGQNGAAGRDGNANVKVDTFILRNADWTFNFYYLSLGSVASSGIQSMRSHDRSFAAITDDVFKRGAVLAFFNTSIANNGENEWTQLDFDFSVGTYAVNYVFQTFPGKVRLGFFFTSTDGSGPNLNNYVFNDTKFKIIAIAGNPVGNSLIRKNGIDYVISDLKSMSHNQVCEVLNIQNQD